MFNLLMLPAFYAHSLQLMREDKPWLDDAFIKYWTTPGWHLYLSPWFILALAAAMWLCVLGLTAFRTRHWTIALWLMYLAHYMTYPYRIRNHMTTLLMGLTLQAVVLLIGWAIGAADLKGRGPHVERIDQWIARGLAGIIVIIYLSAGFHKLNWGYLTIDPEKSSGAETIRLFVYHGGLTSYYPPDWILAGGIYGSLFCELLLPLLILTMRRFQYPLIACMLLFHLPLISVMNVSDYPMIASIFYPALFTLVLWNRLEPHIARIGVWQIGGAILGMSAQIWFMPWWGWMTTFGVVVMGLWGWAIGAMIPATLNARSSQTT